jgi:phosphoserine phosphatase RsbU/P
LSAFFFLSGFTFLFGGANSSYYFLLFVPVACNILFDRLSVTVVYMISTALLMILNVYWFSHFKPYYDIEEWMGTFSYPNIFFITLLIYLGVRLFKEENNKYAEKIEEQNRALEEKNQEITDSINYARKIQGALIPSEEEFNSHFRESFVLFQPKDIVSGDFYWITRKDGHIFYATGDCTGHGVPGGFMTMLGISFLDEIINEKNIFEPAEILNLLRDRIIHTLKQTGGSGESKDGMDIVICRYNPETLVLTYAGANNSLYVFSGQGLKEYPPDKQPCGFHHELRPFSQHSLKLTEGDCIYTFTDGLPDQFGGPKGKKYKYRQMEELALSIQSKSLRDQKKALQNSFEKWKGALEQIDDVCIIGVKI